MVKTDRHRQTGSRMIEERDRNRQIVVAIAIMVVVIAEIRIVKIYL